MKMKLENTYRSLPKRFYMNAKPSNFPEPNLLFWNAELADELELREDLQGLGHEEAAALFAGKTFPEGAEPIHQAYAGHQFGHFNILGDGRALLLGEKVTAEGKRYDFHLKGSGDSVYSRSGDGKAVLAPMLREYLISEAMYALGIPTTRSLAVVLTGEKVFRNEWKDGAVLTRIASSHLRVGTFQLGYMGGKEESKALADYAIERHYPHLKDLPENGEGSRYQKFLAEVIKKQAELICKWQLVGFLHGVMNTDNMTISGETIDYGPCAFMDRYDPATVFSSIDTGGRYRYENQPNIGLWNLSRFAEALMYLLDDNQAISLEKAKQELLQYSPYYKQQWLEGMKNKLGLWQSHEMDETLIEALLELMEQEQADFTNTFVRLTLETEGKDGSYLQGTTALFANERFLDWKQLWQDRQGKAVREQEEIARQMQAANPFVIPRNFRVEEALHAAEIGDYEPFERLFSVLKKPYAYDDSVKYYQELPKEPVEGYRTFCGT